MVGDDHVAHPHFSATRSVSIEAPPANVFPWLRQMGYGRAGWYSYDWIDNLGRPSARVINPAWQQVVTGDPVPAGPIAFVASVVEPNSAFCLVVDQPRVQFSLAFSLVPIDGGTRLISRARSRLDLPLGRVFAQRLLEPGDGIMVRRQLLGIKERAEAISAE